MARSISVKIPTASVLSLVEDKVAQLKTEIAEYPARLEAYKAERKAYTKRVAEAVANAIISGGQELFEGEWQDIVRLTRAYSGGTEITIGKNLMAQFDLGEAPVEPINPSNHYGAENKLKELEKTLTLLRLTPQETVTSSTYNSVLDLL
jgi:predicted PP-loop superfamily ATPase